MIRDWVRHCRRWMSVVVMTVGLLAAPLALRAQERGSAEALIEGALAGRIASLIQFDGRALAARFAVMQALKPEQRSRIAAAVTAAYDAAQLRTRIVEHLRTEVDAAEFDAFLRLLRDPVVERIQGVTAESRRKLLERGDLLRIMQSTPGGGSPDAGRVGLLRELRAVSGDDELLESRTELWSRLLVLALGNANLGCANAHAAVAGADAVAAGLQPGLLADARRMWDNLDRLVYEPVTTEDLRAYIGLWASPDGQALARPLLQAGRNALNDLAREQQQQLMAIQCP